MKTFATKFLALYLVLSLSVFCPGQKAYSETQDPEQTFLINPSLVLDLKTVTNEEIGEAISPLKKGTRAPFAGVLLSPAAVARINVEFDSLSETIDIEVKRMRLEIEAEKEKEIKNKTAEFLSDSSILNAQLDSAQKNQEYLAKELQKEIDNRPSRTTWFILGAGTVTVAATVLYFLVSSSK